MSKPVCVVAGVGPGNGAAFAKTFDKAGYQIVLLGRTQSTLDAVAETVAGSRSYVCDVAQPDQIIDVFGQIKSDLGPVSVLLYNAGPGMFGSMDQIDPTDFETSWRTNALGLLVACQTLAPDMRAAGEGAIIVTGATASVRGGGGFAAFAPAKAAQRSLAQSMARHLSKDGIHVALVIVDGVIDMERTREAMPNFPDNRFMQADDIAESVLALVRQGRSAWTFELDLRPYSAEW